jgi:inner membrane protein
MSSLFTHTYLALSVGASLAPRVGRGRFLALSVLLSVLPDADVIGFRFDIAYGDLLGHRGISHSLLFALLLALTVVSVAFRDISRFSRAWWWLLAWFATITASHGVLDAMTAGGLGIGFFSPFDETRYFLPWRPMLVSPIGIANFFSAYGWRVLLSEMLVVWLPATLLAVGIASWRRGGVRG